MTYDKAVGERAYVLCVKAEPHDRLVCRPRHLMEARRQLSAPATAPSTGGPPSAGSGAIGAAGRVPVPPSGQDSGSTLQTDNRPDGDAFFETAVRPMRELTPIDRFVACVEQTPTCWLWTGSQDGKGYGKFWNGEYGERAHRFAHRTFNEPIPEGLCVLHRCDTPLCVRPSHLFAGTIAENNRDMAAKGRGRSGNSDKAVCVNGHPFTPENTYVHANGTKRACRICRGAIERRKNERRTAARRAALKANRSPAVNEGPAEGATVLAREQV